MVVVAVVAGSAGRRVVLAVGRTRRVIGVMLGLVVSVVDGYICFTVAMDCMLDGSVGRRRVALPIHA